MQVKYLRINISFSVFDYREASTSELVSMGSVNQVLYTNDTTEFVCFAIKFLFSEPYLLFQLITKEANGTERNGNVEKVIRT
jgi:hypothetical protein